MAHLNFLQFFQFALANTVGHALLSVRAPE
jgi:hypothetical protein